MLKDGVYELHYRSLDEPGSACDSLLVALRDGNVLGSDRWGGLLLGRCEFDRATRRHTLRLRLHIPPGGVLVTDRTPREDGDQIDISFTLGTAAERAAGDSVVDLGGQPVRFELEFKGAVP